MIGLTFTSSTGWPAETTHIRLWDVGVTWRDIHTAPGTFDWTRLDMLVAQAGGRHLTYVIGATPRWLAKDPNTTNAATWLGPGSNSMPWSMTYATEFVSALVTRYKGRIAAYEVWNEPQLVPFLTPWDAATRNALASLTQIAKGIISTTDPAAYCLSGAILPRPSSGGITRAGLYLDALAAKGWPIDGFTTHIYPEEGQGVDRWTWMLAQARTAIAAAPKQRLWVTETNYGVPSPTTIPDAQTPALIDGAMAAAGKSAVWWYAWQRPDLGGILLDYPTAAWTALKTYA